MMILTFTVLFMAAVFESQAQTTPSPADAGCPPNSFSGVSDLCGVSCSTVANPSKYCALAINPNGCICKPGFVPQWKTLNNKSLLCVRPEDCTVTCKANMHYEPYAFGCQPTCSRPKVPQPCNSRCRMRCVCNDNYIYDEQQEKCVLPSDCSSPTQTQS